jgi:hypothetical protein
MSAIRSKIQTPEAEQHGHEERRVAQGDVEQPPQIGCHAERQSPEDALEIRTADVQQKADHGKEDAGVADRLRRPDLESFHVGHAAPVRGGQAGVPVLHSSVVISTVALSPSVNCPGFP